MQNNLRAIWALIYKDLLLYLSNRRALIISIVVPIAIAAFFGYLFGGHGGDAGRIDVAIVDNDGGAQSARLVAALQAEPVLNVHPLEAGQVLGLVNKGKLDAAVVLPKGFGAGVAANAGDKPQVQVVYDPSKRIALQIVQGILMGHGMRLAYPAANLAPPFTIQGVEASANDSTHYNSFAHAFAGMGVQFILMMGAEMGIGLLLLRRQGLWQRFRAAPISLGTLLGSRIASGAITAIIPFVVIYAAAIAVFGVRVQGSVAGFVGVILCFGLLTACYGMLIAALARTPEAARGLTMLATLMLVMLGGAWVPTFVFPGWLQTVSRLTPTRWAIDGLDSMTWRGQGWDAALLPMGVMLAFSVVFGLIAAWRFRWDE